MKNDLIPSSAGACQEHWSNVVAILVQGKPKKYTYYITIYIEIYIYIILDIIYIIYDIHDIDINPTKNPEYPMARDVFISSQLSPCIWHCNGAGTDAHLFGVGNFDRQFIGNLARLGHLWINWFGSNNLPPMGSKKHQAPVHFSTMPVPVRVRKTNSRNINFWWAINNPKYYRDFEVIKFQSNVGFIPYKRGSFIAHRGFESLFRWSVHFSSQGLLESYEDQMGMYGAPTPLLHIFWGRIDWHQPNCHM